MAIRPTHAHGGHAGTQVRVLGCLPAPTPASKPAYKYMTAPSGGRPRPANSPAHRQGGGSGPAGGTGQVACAACDERLARSRTPRRLGTLMPLIQSGCVTTPLLPASLCDSAPAATIKASARPYTPVAPPSDPAPAAQQAHSRRLTPPPCTPPHRKESSLSHGPPSGRESPPEGGGGRQRRGGQPGQAATEGPEGVGPSPECVPRHAWSSSAYSWRHQLQAPHAAAAAGRREGPPGAAAPQTGEA